MCVLGRNQRSHAAGDEVILYPGDRVTDGQRVKPVKI
jgi:hypothetical protein